MSKLIEQLKQAGQDHEFYPTTNEIISKLLNCMKGHSYGYNSKCTSFLDIGAGNGKVIKAVQAMEDCSINEYYAIEKSAILRDQLPASVYVIGTEFEEQSLFDKSVDVTFCNPPYREFERWAVKIIRESCSKYVYMVIPRRWKDNQEIGDALKFRDAKFRTVGEFSFADAEDRAARAIVDLVQIQFQNAAWESLFDEQFAELKTKYEAATGNGGNSGDDDDTSASKRESEEEKRAAKFGGLVLGSNFVAAMVELYKADLANIQKNYEAVYQLDPGLMKEFGITPKSICECLKLRMKGLKSLYWQELISRMSEITDRLTAKRRNKIFEKLNSNGSVDFTASNVYAVVVWILKNAAEHIDGQLIETYEQMIDKANCHNYKSNKRVFTYDRWRYQDEKPSHIYLDYRIVISRYRAIDPTWGGKARIGESAADFLRDLLTVANNLRFSCSTNDPRLVHWNSDTGWHPGKPQEFFCVYKGKREVLFEAKLHLNGNIHLRLNQKFALAINVEFGRLKGWVHSKETAATELQNRDAAEYFKTQFLCLAPSGLAAIEDKTEQPAEAKEEPPLISDAEALSFLDSIAAA